MAHGKSLELRNSPLAVKEEMIHHSWTTTENEQLGITFYSFRNPEPYRNPDRPARKRAQLEQRRAAAARRTIRH